MLFFIVDAAILLLSIGLFSSLVLGKCFTLGHWRHRASDRYRYWEGVASYTILLIVLAFVRLKLGGVISVE